jgi:hypothetical protein
MRILCLGEKYVEATSNENSHNSDAYSNAADFTDTVLCASAIDVCRDDVLSLLQLGGL